MDIRALSADVPLSPRTIELYRWQLLKHILPTLGKIELRHLEASAVRVLVISAADGPGRQPRPSATDS